MVKKIFRFIFLTVGLVFVGCYSFKGIDIPEDVKTFYVKKFENRSSNVVPTLSLTFTERLKDKVRNESRLIYQDVNPDISFSGAITEYAVQSIAPQAGEKTAFNQLSITVSVDFANSKNDKKNWKQSFNYKTNFPASQNLLSVQDQLITEMTEQLVEDIFNKAFTDW